MANVQLQERGGQGETSGGARARHAAPRAEPSGVQAQLGSQQTGSQQTGSQQTANSFDAVLLELLSQQAASTMNAGQQGALSTDRTIDGKQATARLGQAEGKAQGKAGAQGTTKIKSLATAAAEQELAGAAELSPRSQAQATLRAAEESGEQSQRGGQRRVHRRAGGGEHADVREDDGVLRQAESGATRAPRGMDGGSLLGAQSGIAAGQSKMKTEAQSGARTMPAGITAARGAGQAARAEQAGEQKVAGVSRGSAAMQAASPQPNGQAAHTTHTTAMLKRLEASTPAAQATRAKTLQQGVERATLSGLALALKDGEGAATVRLAPAELGQLSLRMDVREGEVRLTAQTQTESARELLNASMPALREALEAKGLHVRELHVQGPDTGDNTERVQDARTHARSEDQEGRDAGGQAGEGGAFDGGQQREQGGQRMDALPNTMEGLTQPEQARAEREQAREEETLQLALAEPGALQWIA